MDYAALMDLVSRMGTRLISSGAETYRVEETISRILAAYGQEGRVYCVPNSLFITIRIPDKLPFTQLCRIPMRTNDIDTVERYNSLSRRICTEVPDLSVALEWVQETEDLRKLYSYPMNLMGHILVASGFCYFFGGNLADCLCAAACGLFLGIVCHFLSRLEANNFFQQISAAFLMSGFAYTLAHWGLSRNIDTVVIGTLMLLVPGLLFTNAMRDVMYGDTNSGLNRVVLVLLIAVAIALGTAAALGISTDLWGSPVNEGLANYGPVMLNIGCFIGCIGFSIYYNIHGPGILICTIGGILTWSTYLLALHLGIGVIYANFIGGIVASVYAETMARIRRFPAISYLVVSLFPLLPGAGIYYAMAYAVENEMTSFAQKGFQTAAIAGALALGILLVSTAFRIYSNYRMKKRTA